MFCYEYGLNLEVGSRTTQRLGVRGNHACYEPFSEALIIARTPESPLNCMFLFFSVSNLSIIPFEPLHYLILDVFPVGFENLDCVPNPSTSDG